MIKEGILVPPKRASQQQKTRQRQLKRAIKFIAYVGLSVLAAFTSLSTSYVTASFFATGQWKRLSTLGLLILSVLILLIAIEFFVKFLNNVLYKLNEKLDWAADALANFVINQIEIFLLRLWWQLTAPRLLRIYYNSLVDRHRDFEIEGFQENLRVVDLEDVFVPLQVADEVLGNIPGAMLQNDPSLSYEIWDFLDISKEKNYRSRHIAVIAPPGSGKTTILKHLALTYAQNKQHRQAPKLIPILLYLRQIHNEISREQQPNLPELTTAQEEKVLSDYKVNLPPNWFEEQLKQGRCLVMLDGLDEVADSSQRQKVSKWISDQMKAYHKNAFILTSRKHRYLSTQLEKVGRVLTVKPFNISQIKDFLTQWYLQTEIKRHNGRNDVMVRTRAQQCADDLLERIKNSYQIATMAQNPLLLAMIATVHYMKKSLPERRVELYKKICDVLLGDRQLAKKIPDILTPGQKKGVLQVLALSLMRQNIVEFDRNLGISLIKEKLEAVTSEVTPDQFLDEAETVNGLLMQIKEGSYSFVHKSFQEYLAAVQIDKLKEEQLLIENFYDEWWTETIRLYAAKADDATNLASEALNNRNLFSLTLAYNFLEEAATIKPQVREQLKELLEDGLESSQLEIAKLAAQVKLSHRLKKQFFSENVIIDKSYITCAEYQLFIEEKLKEGQDFRPVHWKAERFAHGDAKKPITGVYAKAAQEFCEWLTQKYLLLEFRYRLPNLAEAEREQPTTEQPVGCWCQDGDTKALANIKPFQWKIWKQDLVNACARDLVIARDLNSVFNQETDIDLAVALYHAGFLERADTLPPNRTFALENVIDLECDLTVIFDGIITLDQKQAQKLELVINQTIERAEERISRRRNTLTSKLDTTFKAKNAAHNSLTHAEDCLQNCITTVKPFQDKVSECQEKYDETNKLEQSLRKQIEQKQNLQKELAQARQQIETLESQLKEARLLEEAHQPDKTLEDKLKKARQQADEIERQLQQEEVIQNIAPPHLELKKVRKVAQSLRDKLEEARQRAAPFERQLEETRQRVESFKCEVDQASKEFKSLEHELTNIETLQNKLASVHSSGTHRSYLLFIYMLLDSLVGCNYATKKAELHKLYILLVLKDERQSGHMPAWEGIRIVGEKV